MTPEFILAWLAAGVAMLLGVPQIVRLVRTRSTDGLSLLLWQTMLSINLGWLSHGLRIGELNMVVPNLVGMGTTLTILFLMIRARGLRPVRILVPGLLGAVALVAVDLGLGAAAFGVAAVVPAVLANTGQSVELVRSPRVTGVAPVFLVGQVLNQVLWFSWSLLSGDPGTMITSPVTGVIALFNVVWWTLRRAGLRPLFVRPLAAPVVAAGPAQVSCES